MALDAGFVVAVLEGIEGTLDEVIERVDHAELKASLALLRAHEGERPSVYPQQQLRAAFSPN